MYIYIERERDRYVCVCVFASLGRPLSGGRHADGARALILV